MKRAFDFTVASIGLIVASPLLIVVMAAIWLHDFASPFYIAPRMARGGGLFRMIQLFIIRDVHTGVVWALKVLSDPFHNIALYYKSPLALMRGELIDPAIGTAQWDDDEAEEAPYAT